MDGDQLALILGGNGAFAEQACENYTMARNPYTRGVRVATTDA